MVRRSRVARSVPRPCSVTTVLGVPLTLGITVVAFGAGPVAAFPIALARIANRPLLGPLAVAWVEFFRPPPPLVHVVWADYALPVILDVRLPAFSIIAGALACGTSAQMADILRVGLLAVPRGHSDAARVLGLSTWHRLWSVVLPVAKEVAPKATFKAFGQSTSVDLLLEVIVGRADAVVLDTPIQTTVTRSVHGDRIRISPAATRSRATCARVASATRTGRATRSSGSTGRRSCAG